VKVEQIIQFWVYDGTTWIDYSDGLINCNIIRGCQSYIGPTTQPDVGQLTVTSRNINLDPYENDGIRYNKLIRVTANGERIFTGKIDGVNVEYRPLGEDPVITLTAIDIIGSMQKHILSEDFVQANPSAWTTFYLLQLLDLSDEVPDFHNPIRLTTGLNNVASGINTNTTAWEALSQRSATDLGFVYADDHNEIYYYRLPIDNALHPNNARPIKAYFASDGSELSYRTIKLSDGFDNITNSLTLNAISGAWSGSPLVYTNTSATFQRETQPSIDLWGKSRNTLNMLSVSSSIGTDIADAVFDEMSNPVREVYQISWDATLDPNSARTIDILDNININHQVGNVNINRKYGIIGIQHSITPTDWNITYLLRNWNFKETAMGNPVISVTPTTGDQFTDWTFSFAFDQMDEVASVAWDLGEGFTSTSMSPTVNYVTAGAKHVSLIVTNIYGWEKTATFELTVGGAPPLNSWTYSQGALGIYQFTFTGQEAVSYLWNFGDGTTSTEMNPQKFYTVAGSRTVTCSATNAYGTSQSSQTFTPTVVTVLPVRYVQFAFKDYQWETVSNSGADRLTNIWVGTSSTNYAANKTLTSEKYMAQFQGSGSTDTYGRIPRRNDTELTSTLLNSTIGAGALKFVWTIAGGGPNYSNDFRTKMILTVDLGSYYFDINSIRMYTQQTGHIGTVKVATSYDQSTWYDTGTVNFTGSSTLQVNMTPTATLPVTFSFSPITHIQNYMPIRYIRVVTNNTSFKISEIIPWDSYMATYSGTLVMWGISGGFGYGGINPTMGSNHTNSTTSTNVLYGTPSGTYSPGQYMGLKTNDKNVTTNVYAGGTSNFSRTIDIDCGTIKKNIFGFLLDTRDENGAGGGGGVITIYTSQDNTNWTNLGTFTAHASGLTKIYQKDTTQAEIHNQISPIPATGWSLVTEAHT
jgi:PKD repeat protein